MKYHIMALAATILLAIQPLAAQKSAKAQWHSAKEASTANTGERLYMFDFYTDWCGYCKKMDRETFTDPTVIAILNKYYYPVKFHAEQEGPFQWRGQTYKVVNYGRNGMHQFAMSTLGQRMGFPSFAIFTSDRQLLQVIPGFYPAKDFAMILWYFASGDYKKYAFDRYQQIFDTDIRPQMQKAIK